MDQPDKQVFTFLSTVIYLIAKVQPAEEDGRFSTAFTTLFNLQWYWSIQPALNNKRGYLNTYFYLKYRISKTLSQQLNLKNIQLTKSVLFAVYLPPSGVHVVNVVGIGFRRNLQV